MKLNRKNLEKIWVIEPKKEMDIMDFWHTVNFFTYQGKQRVQNLSCGLSFEQLKHKFKQYQEDNKKFALDWRDFKHIKTWAYEYYTILKKQYNKIYIYNRIKGQILTYKLKIIKGIPKVRINYKWYAIWDKIKKPNLECLADDLPF